MGRPFNEKFASVRWETNEEHLQAWKEGRTGVPIVDAAMRQCKVMGMSTCPHDASLKADAIQDGCTIALG